MPVAVNRRFEAVYHQFGVWLPAGVSLEWLTNWRSWFIVSTERFTDSWHG
jgi:hypothetical protein